MPLLCVADILCWADRFHARTGRWPLPKDGAIASTNETWMGVHGALRHGHRGLPGGSSLARLLAEHRGYRNVHGLPPLDMAQILDWADAFRAQSGRWPTMYAGPVAGTANETWHRIDSALRREARGLRGHSSLAQLLAKYRGVQNLTSRPRLNAGLIVRWAKRHHGRTGRWPTEACAAVAEAPSETWRGIDRALRAGVRGLAGGSSLAQLLAHRCGVRNLKRLPVYTVKQILRWADAHHRRTGQWPHSNLGAIPGAPGETWGAVQSALRHGRRGLPGGSSLARLLAEFRGVPHPQDRRRLTLAQVRAWAAAHLERTGRWPKPVAEPIPEAPEETWQRLDRALREGVRGLRDGSSLLRLRPRRPRQVATHDPSPWRSGK